MKILHISDTHGYHLQFPESRFEGIDLVIHSGDAANYLNPAQNSHEMFEFLEWYTKVPVKYKIFVAGNHDTSVEARLITRENFSDRGIVYLENEYTEIEGIKIFGTPIVPRYGNWAFMKDRGTIDRFWKKITKPMDVFVVHGPPKGILDYTYKREDNRIEMCGCSSLRTHIRRLNPKLVLFGHIHNCKDIVNNYSFYKDGITYSNAACVEDGKFGQLISHGNILEI